MIYVIVAILILEIARLILSLDDRRRVNILNDKALKLAAERKKAEMKIRLLELDGLKDLAEGSKELKAIFDDFKDKGAK